MGRRSSEHLQNAVAHQVSEPVYWSHVRCLLGCILSGWDLKISGQHLHGGGLPEVKFCHSGASGLSYNTRLQTALGRQELRLSTPKSADKLRSTLDQDLRFFPDLWLSGAHLPAALCMPRRTHLAENEFARSKLRAKDDFKLLHQD